MNEENFPDANFRTWLENSLGFIEGDVITTEMIQRATFIDITSESITNLKGVEHLTVLEELYCCYNQLTSLDMSKNAKLYALACCDNQLTSLDVSGCTRLGYLICYGNQLTSLDISNNPNLLDVYKMGEKTEEDTKVKYVYLSNVLWIDKATQIISE